MQLKQLELVGGGALTVYLRDSCDRMPSAIDRPMVLVVPGGGYTHVSAREGDPVALQFAAAGYHTAVLDYAICEQAKNYLPLRQLAQAIGLVREHAAAWHVLPDKIAVCGFSAGGHLALSSAVLEIPGEADQPYQKKQAKEQPFQLLVDIQGKMAEGKSVGYKKWATKFNLKEMTKTLLFLQEQKIGSADELRERAAAATERYHVMGDSIKAAEARLTEIAVLKTHIINYAKTRPVYDAYRKSGYSKKFLEAHREEITLHKAAKAAFDEAGLQKLPKVKELDAEFAELLTKKKAAYPDYRKVRNEMQELVRAQKNVERFFAEEKDTTEKTQTR